MLDNPEARRGLRSVVMSIVVLALLALVWVKADRLTNEASLLEVIRWCLGIIAIFTLLYGAENVTRAVRFAFGPVSGSIGEEEPTQ